MKKYIHYRVNLLTGLLSFNALCACVHTRPTLNMDPQQNDNTAAGNSANLVTVVASVVQRDNLDNLAINAQDSQGFTPLMRVVMDENESKVEHLVDNGADVNIQNDDGDTALHMATRIGFVNGVAILLKLKNKVNVNIQNEDGDTALHIAGRNKDEKIIRLLLEKGPDDIRADLKNQKGETFLSIAEKNGIEIKANWVKVIGN